MVATTRFELAIPAVKGQCLKPLDYVAIYLVAEPRVELGIRAYGALRIPFPYPANSLYTMSGWQELNLLPFGPEPNALPN
jgi:hypothetical protein